MDPSARMAAALAGPADPEIVACEARLRAAQLDADVAALDALIADVMLDEPVKLDGAMVDSEAADAAAMNALDLAIDEAAGAGPAADDGKVSVARAAVPGMAQLRLVPHSHGFLMRAPVVIAETFAFLERGRFDAPAALPAPSAAAADSLAR